MNRPRDIGSGARGGFWIWKCPETGHVIRHSNYAGCKNEVKKFLKINSFPIGLNFNQEFDENLCANGQPGLCEEFVPPTIWDKMTSAGQALFRAAKQWRKPVVSVEVLMQRRVICETCNYFGGSTSLLKVACQKCGCSGLKLALSSERCPLSPPKWT